MKKKVPIERDKILYYISICFAGLFLLLNITLIFVPLNPDMPKSGLDPSWQFALAYATAEQMIFGKDIIFTFGPFSQIYTKLFHPETDLLMLASAIYLSLTYWIAFVCLLHGRSSSWWWICGIGLLCLPLSTDSILLLYPVMVALIFTKGDLAQFNDKKSNGSLYLVLAILLFSSLGLLVLIKGMLLPLSILMLSLSLGKFLQEKKYHTGVLGVSSFLFALFFFWALAGQPIDGLYKYFVGLIPITSGYSEAMARQGPAIETLSYLVAAMGILWIILIQKRPIRDRFYLLTIFSAYLFFSFKHGFVRHGGGHAASAGTAILAATVLLGISVKTRYYFLIVLVALFSWVIIDGHYVATSTRSVGNLYLYQNALDGLKLRFEGGLEEKYKSALDVIATEDKIPLVEGSSDIYSFDQASLIASGNNWSPRPVFQSYSAYTSALAIKNATHLSGKKAPDNIFFKVQPIDRRLPSLEDGKSWPALLGGYRPSNFMEDRLLLEKWPQKTGPRLMSLHSTVADLGSSIKIPTHSTPIFVEIQLEETLFGKFLSFLYKPSQLQVDLTLRNGHIQSYRFIANMARSGFFISPLVQNTKDFSYLYSEEDLWKYKTVYSFSIKPLKWDWVWNDSCVIKFYSADYGVHKLSNSFFKFNNMRKHDLVIHSSTKEGFGSISAINGERVTDKIDLRVSRILSVRGWFALSVEKNVMPESIYLFLSDNNNTFYIKTETYIRQDVANYFNKPFLRHTGFKVDLKLPEKLKGEYRLGLVYQKEGKFYKFTKLRKNIIITK